MSCATPGLGQLLPALELAQEVHSGQVRKGTAIPYVAHLLALAALVLEDGGGDDKVIAALLHDAVEDGGGAPVLERIRQRFGERVAAIVAACSDTDQDPKPPWRERKQAYLAHLRETADEGALRVSLADKLHNAGSILLDYRTHGEKLWERFNAPSAADQLWYYNELAEIFGERRPGPMSADLRRVVDEVTELVRQGPSVGSPLAQLDSFLGDVASRVGGEVHGSLAGELTDEDREAVDRCLRLVGNARLDHSLTTGGCVVVPVDDGSRTIILDPIKLNGQEWINVWMPLLEGLPPDAEADERIAAFLGESNLYYGAKFLLRTTAITVMLDLPCEGLETPALIAAMERIAWVAEACQEDLRVVGAGQAPRGVWQVRDLPLTNPLRMPGD